MRKKKGKRNAAVKILCMAVAATLFMQAIPVYAYFDRGTLSVTLAQGEVELTPGNSVSVSVTLSPATSQQLPGCGMPECPQTCGDGCLNEDGDCTCAGTDYQTYYAAAAVSSSNTSVATASYSNGSVTVTAVSAGTASITVTGSLRQYTSASAVLEVTVTENSGNASGGSSNSSGNGGNSSSGSSGSNSNGTSGSSSGNSGSGSKSGTSSSGTSGGGSSNGSTGNNSSENGSKSSGNSSGSSNSSESNSSERATENGAVGSLENQSESASTSDVGVTVATLSESTHAVDVGLTAESQSDAQDGTEALTDGTEQGTEAASYTTIESKKGTVYFQEIQDGPMGSEIFEKIKGKDEYVTFQKTDSSKNVLYSWEFYGKDLQSTDDIDMNIELSEDGNGSLSSLVEDKTALCLSFAEIEELPGPAEIYIKAGNTFSNGTDLYLYQMEDSKHLQLMADDVKAESGYVSYKMAEAKTYILTAEKIADTQAESGVLLPVILLVLLLIAAAGVVFVFLKKRGKHD